MAAREESAASAALRRPLFLRGEGARRFSSLYHRCAGFPLFDVRVTAVVQIPRDLW